MLFMFFYRVVIWLPAFQLLTEETLSQVRLALSGTVDEVLAAAICSEMQAQPSKKGQF